jgi:hypothetical protein
MTFQLDIQEVSGVTLALRVPTNIFDDDGNILGPRPEEDVVSERQRRLKHGQFRVVINDINGNQHKAVDSPIFDAGQPEDRIHRLYTVLMKAATLIGDKLSQ